VDLNIKDICFLLNANERYVMSLIDKRDIPFYKMHHHYRFNKGEISEWILRRGSFLNDAFFKLQKIDNPLSVVENIKNGGIYYNIEGNDIASVIRNSVELLPLSANINRETLLSYLLEREEVMPTYIGSGIAVPHPKKPIISETEKQFIAVCFLKDEFVYRDKNNEKLHTLFVIISSNQSNHLKTLSLISYVLHNRRFVEILKERASKDEIYFEMEKALMEKL